MQCLQKMVYKSMDKKNMLLYSFSIILSVALEMVFGTAFMVNDKYGLNEKTGSMNWLCTMFFLAAGVMSIFLSFIQRRIMSGQRTRITACCSCWEAAENLYSNFFLWNFCLFMLFLWFWVFWQEGCFPPCFCLFLAYFNIWLRFPCLMLSGLSISYESKLYAFPVRISIGIIVFLQKKPVRNAAEGNEKGGEV